MEPAAADDRPAKRGLPLQRCHLPDTFDRNAGLRGCAAWRHSTDGSTCITMQIGSARLAWRYWSMNAITT